MGMSEIVHADIFFFITSIAVIVVGIGMSVFLFFGILIVRDIRAVVQKVRKASDELEKDFEDLRASVKGEGARVKTVFELMLGFIARQIPKSRTKKQSGNSGDE